eukprot:scaffold1353_cov161-Amphora_coffeaeformis.AAC.21
MRLALSTASTYYYHSRTTTRSTTTALVLACWGTAARAWTTTASFGTATHARRPLATTVAASYLPTRHYYYHSTAVPLPPHCIRTSTIRLLATTSSTDSSSNMSSTNDASFKRARLDEKPASSRIIGTHSGTFQADEAMGVWLLQQLTDYRRAKVVRSRDPAVLAPLDIVIDVGGVYDHESLRYDHHQRGYDERFDQGKKQGSGRVTKLSASGLVYRHYGRQILQEFYPALPEPLVSLAYTKIYNKLMEALDAIDTGVEMAPEGVELLYRDSTGLSARVGRLNPRWNEVDETTGQKPDADARFAQAVDLCGQDFVSVMTQVVESDLPGRKFVEEALQKRLETDPSSGQIICFPYGGLPWKDHLYELEKEHNIDPLIKFVLYQDESGMWRVQAVTVEGRGFENRLSLPASWRGVRDEDLATISGIPGARFCHAAGFIGGANTYEGALAMAKAALAGKE